MSYDFNRQSQNVVPQRSQAFWLPSVYAMRWRCRFPCHEYLDLCVYIDGTNPHRPCGGDFRSRAVFAHSALRQEARFVPFTGEKDVQFTVSVQTHHSLAELLRLHRQGAYVVKTPHVGNFYPNNLAIMKLGIPMLLVDQTLGMRDRNFHPHCVIVNGQAERVACGHRLTSHARITAASVRVPNRFFEGGSLMEAHVQALHDAFPNTPLSVASAQILRHPNIVRPFLRALTEMNPAAWTRKVLPDGTVHTVQRPPACWSEVERDGVHGETPQGAGWIIPNAWNLLLDGVIGSLTTRRDVVYSLSGPDMVKYYRALEQEMHDGYCTLHSVFPALPETLTMVMVPVADMRLVTTVDRAGALQNVMDVYFKLLTQKQSIGLRLNGHSAEERRVLLPSILEERGRIRYELREAVRACPELFYEIHQASYLSQYDLLAGKELFIHPWGIEAPIQQVIDAIRLFRELHAPS